MTWKTILVFAVLILVGFGVWAYERKMREKKIQEIVTEQAVIQTDLENEVEKLDQERTEYIKQIAAIKLKVNGLNKERDELKGKLNEIESRLANIPVPRDLSGLSEKFKGRGFNPVLRP